MSKKVNVGMHLNVYELIWFKLGMMIDTKELYMFILVRLTMTLFQGHMGRGGGGARKQICLCQLSHKVLK